MARIINVNIWFANERILQARGNSITNTMYPHYQHEITLLQARDNHPTSTYRSPPYGGGVGGGAFGVAAWASCGFVVPPVTSAVRCRPFIHHLSATLPLIINYLHRYTPQNGTMSLKNKNAEGESLLLRHTNVY
mgnify:FL=1